MANPRTKKPPRPLAAYSELGNDRWQAQADAAAWAAVSGMHPSLYLGAIEPIPVPADLKARLREAGRAMADRPTTERADALLRLAHEAAYGTQPAEAALPASPVAAEQVSGADWWDAPVAAEKPLADALAEFAAQTFDALVNRQPDPVHDAERAAIYGKQGDWWDD